LTLALSPQDVSPLFENEYPPPETIYLLDPEQPKEVNDDDDEDYFDYNDMYQVSESH